MPEFRIDLYSDTKTRPTPAMRQAMLEAEIGDEQHFEDPTVADLVARVAALLGKEDAVFLPSGTMANEVAILVHCARGDEIIAHEQSHVLNFEGGAAAALAGVMVKPVPGARGIFSPETLRAVLRREARHLPRSRLVVIEQTTNLGGGAVWPLAQVESVTGEARAAGLRVHMDGARLMNAVVASGTPAAEFAARCDTVYLDFTKGLGAPFGAVLAGSRDEIAEAWRWKQRLGGSMRQAGILAAACLHALDHHVGRLGVDHENARLLAERLAAVPGISVEPVETNMVYFDVSATGMTAAELNARLEQRAMRCSIQGPMRLRAVTHLDTSAAMMAEFTQAVSEILAG